MRNKTGSYFFEFEEERCAEDIAEYLASKVSEEVVFQELARRVQELKGDIADPNDEKPVYNGP